MTATAADVVLCHKKRHYETKVSARRAAALYRKQKGHAMFWYRCPVCGKFCLTGQPRRHSDVTKAEKGQRAPIRNPTLTKPNIPHNERTHAMLTPTAEQADAIEVFNAELSMAVDALAGTGKSSTLRMIGESSPRRGQYVAFNRAVVDDAKASFPSNVACSTAHSLAFRAVGRNYQHRLQQPRVRSYELAKRLGISKAIVIELGGGAKKVLQPGYQASFVLRALKMFAFSSDPEPTVNHFEWIDGIDTVTADGRRSRVSNEYVARTLMPSLMKAWADWQDPSGTLPFTHDAYVKIWEQNTPIIPGDFVLIDEAQDLSPVMMSVIEQQTDIQTTWVGDANQQLYEWRGSVDAMSIATVDARTRLSQSFRFGHAIAELANAILDRIPNSDPLLRVRGLGSIDSVLAAVEQPNAILTRTNATAIRQVLLAQKDGRRPHLVGGGTEVAMFARAAGELIERRHTSYHDLACFESWLEVQAYVEDDPQGSELALMTHLVDDFGVDTILNALDNMPPESDADLIVSTAHKSKGREWSSVQLTDDFAVEDEKPDVGELRLLYVAVTRAKHTLDVFACDPLADLVS